MSGAVEMNNNPLMSRKRPLTDANVEMNTPKRECYQQFHPYQYMNMMAQQPMFHSTPFRGDENHHLPPPFMTPDFCPSMQMQMNVPPFTPFSCSPMNLSAMSNTSSNDSGISGGSCSSSCESTPSTSAERTCTSKDDEVLFQVPSRLNHISKNKVTLGELKRRLAAPECLNSSFLGIYLRLAKTKEVGKELRDNLAKHGISLPSGRRKGIQNTVFTCLVEEEATQLGRDMHTLVQQHYPIRPLIDMAARKSVSHPDERRRDLIGAIRILDELNGMFTELQTPLATRVQNNVPIHNELELGMNHFSLITHTFGPINQSTWCNAFLNYAKMSLSMYQNRGMDSVNPQGNCTVSLKKYEGDVRILLANYGPFEHHKEDEMGDEVALVKYHSRNRKHTFVLNRSEAEHEIVLKFEICNVIGYRYVYSVFLSIHSPYFAQRFAKLLSNNHGNVLCCANDYQSEHFTDLEVIRFVKHFATDRQELRNHILKSRNVLVMLLSPSTAGGAEPQLCGVEDVDFEEFRILLEAIYPPGCEIDEGTLRPLLHLSHKFSIDHVVRRCELYLKSAEGSSCFDLFTRLEIATAYKLADLQEECLRMLTSASSVRDLLDDPRLENASSDIRTILLEAFLRRCTKGVSGNNGFVGEAVSTDEERKMSPSPTDVTVTEEKPEYLDDNNNVPDDRDLELDPAHSSEPSLHEQLIREIGVRKNLEMSLKCMRDFILNSEMKQPKWARPNVVEDELLGSLEERVSRLEEVVFDTFDATKLSKDRYVTCNQKVFSMYDIFHDFVLEPYSSTECATYAFVSHFFIKKQMRKDFDVLW
ncbi:unnamed protein product [Nippostrongylus brasiliensis]|uniref:BTB domain-containing protein n=1 Tax=Nippostrongylus brasiliensis TaxID=27835 RepID=A0A158QYS2_NIPBR|nr:unnamed protein product [Nippostrongylus brasiliensis]